MAAETLTRAQEQRLAGRKLQAVKMPGGLALMVCQARNCDCSFTVVLRKYLALEDAEIGCPRCSGKGAR